MLKQQQHMLVVDRAFAVHSQENEGSGISFSSDGKKMFITGHAKNKIHQWDLSTAFDPSTKSNLVSKVS